MHGSDSVYNKNIHKANTFSTSSYVKINKNFSVKLAIFSFPSVLTYVLCAQKNRLIEMVLLSTSNIYFG